jgi:hypothetical protein
MGPRYKEFALHIPTCSGMRVLCMPSSIAPYPSKSFEIFFGI